MKVAERSGLKHIELFLVLIQRSAQLSLGSLRFSIYERSAFFAIGQRKPVFLNSLCTHRRMKNTHPHTQIVFCAKKPDNVNVKCTTLETNYYNPKNTENTDKRLA